jgi:hypothetical protein
MKMLARVSGADHIYEAPPLLDPRQIVRRGDVLHGEIVRGPDASGQAPTMVYRPDVGGDGMVPPGVAGHGAGPHGLPGAQGQMPSWGTSQIPQTGRPAGGNGNGELAEATKRQQVEAHLAGLPAGQLDRLDGLGPRAAARELTATLNGQGLQVSERHVMAIWDAWNAARRQATGSRKRKQRG